MSCGCLACVCVCVCRITEAWLTQLWQYLGGADTLAGVAASGWPILPCVSALDSSGSLATLHRLVPSVLRCVLICFVLLRFVPMLWHVV